jgi:hypothetical protein
MRANNVKLLLLVAIAAGTTQCVAGEFVNLTFDEPDMSQFQDGKAPIEAAFRGWSFQWDFVEPPRTSGRLEVSVYLLVALQSG